jgi:steroid delta-isomerase-like uncharacterized protein
MDSKDVIKRLFDEVLNGDRRDLLDEMIADDYLEHNPVPGQLPGSEGIRLKLEAFRAAFHDLYFDLEEIISEGSMVAVCYHWEATNKGDFMAIPATGRRVSVRGMDFYRVKGGKIVEHWDSVDQLGLLRQLGAIS